MAHILGIGENNFNVELLDIVDREGGLYGFEAIVTCRNGHFAMLQNKINQIAQDVFNNFQPDMDERVAAFMLAGNPAKYHIDVKGSLEQLNAFRGNFEPDNAMIID